MIKDSYVWVAIGTLVAGAIWWASENSRDTKDAVDEVNKLKIVVENLSVDSIRNDIQHIRNDIERLYKEAETRANYREVIVRQEEHIRSLDARVVNIERRNSIDKNGEPR